MIDSGFIGCASHLRFKENQNCVINFIHHLKSRHSIPTGASNPQRRIYVIEAMAVEDYKWEQST